MEDGEDGEEQEEPGSSGDGWLPLAPRWPLAMRQRPG